MTLDKVEKILVVLMLVCVAAIPTIAYASGYRFNFNSYCCYSKVALVTQVTEFRFFRSISWDVYTNITQDSPIPVACDFYHRGDIVTLIISTGGFNASIEIVNMPREC